MNKVELLGKLCIETVKTIEELRKEGLSENQILLRAKDLSFFIAKNPEEYDNILKKNDKDDLKSYLKKTYSKMIKEN